MSLASLAQRIEKAALACGLDQCGIIPVEDLAGFGPRLEERMEKAPASAGFYGNMARLEDIKTKYPWGRSIVVCTFDYSRYRYPRELQGLYGKSFFLSPEPGGTAGYDLNRFEQFLTETGIRWEGGNHVGFGGVGPLRYEAMKAGLGIIRKNNFFYTENGSYVSLFSYLIDQPCTLIHQPNIPPCAESCTLCQRACKTKALCAPYTMDPGNCVSFLTTFGKGNVPEHLDEGMLEEWICGCDNCQDACPYSHGGTRNRSLVLILHCAIHGNRLIGGQCYRNFRSVSFAEFHCPAAVCHAILFEGIIVQHNFVIQGGAGIGHGDVGSISLQLFPVLVPVNGV